MRASGSGSWNSPEAAVSTGNTPIRWIGRPAGHVANTSPSLDTNRTDRVHWIPPSTYATHRSRLFRATANACARLTTGRCGSSTTHLRHTVPRSSSHGGRILRPSGHGRRVSRSSGHGRRVPRPRSHGGRNTSTTTNSIAPIRPPSRTVVSDDGT